MNADIDPGHDPAVTRWVVTRARALALFKEVAQLAGMQPDLIRTAFDLDPVVLSCRNRSAMEDRVEALRQAHPILFTRPAVAAGA